MNNTTSEWISKTRRDKECITTVKAMSCDTDVCIKEDNEWIAAIKTMSCDLDAYIIEDNEWIAAVKAMSCDPDACIKVIHSDKFAFKLETCVTDKSLLTLYKRVVTFGTIHYNWGVDYDWERTVHFVELTKPELEQLSIEIDAYIAYRYNYLIMKGKKLASTKIRPFQCRRLIILKTIVQGLTAGEHDRRKKSYNILRRHNVLTTRRIATNKVPLTFPQLSKEIVNKLRTKFEIFDYIDYKNYSQHLRSILYKLITELVN